jgi:cytoskeletal protein RodZ
MGQEIRGVAEATALNRDPERSIGAYLARQRELRGFTLDDLAAQTRIPRRSLERLESGIFDRAPDGFVRGFVRTVAAALGLDPDEAVMRLLREPDAEAASEEASRAVWAGPGLRGVAVAVVALCLVGGIAWLVASLAGRPDAAPSEEIVVRRDPIRALARDLEAGRIRIPAPAKPPAPEPEVAAESAGAEAPRAAEPPSAGRAVAAPPAAAPPSTRRAVEASPPVEAPSVGAPVEGPPVEGAPLEVAPVEVSPVEEAPVDEPPVDEPPRLEAPGGEGEPPVEQAAPEEPAAAAPTPAAPRFDPPR